MGRVEKTLLFFLAISVAAVSWLSLQSAARVRAREAASRPATDQSRPTTVTRNSDEPSPATQSLNAHVIAATVRSARPAPVRDIAAIRREIASRASSTYIDFMLQQNDSSIFRWPERYGEPVKVWIEPASPVPGWNASFASGARDAFGMWNSIRVPVRFDFVSDSASAEIVVVWVDHFGGSQAGSTKRFRDQHGWLGRAEILLALRTAQGHSIDSRYQSAVIIHEIGHALGLDHSPNASDIMAERNDGVFVPTPADRSTLELLYSVLPGPIR